MFSATWLLVMTKKRMERIQNIWTKVLTGISCGHWPMFEWNFSQKSYEEIGANYHMTLAAAGIIMSDRCITAMNKPSVRTTATILSHSIIWYFGIFKFCLSYSCGPQGNAQVVTALEDVILARFFVPCLSSYLSVCVLVFSKSLFADAGLMALQRRAALNTFPPSWQIAVPAARRAPDSL